MYFSVASSAVCNTTVSEATMTELPYGNSVTHDYQQVLTVSKPFAVLLKNF